MKLVKMLLLAAVVLAAASAWSAAPAKKAEQPLLPAAKAAVVETAVEAETQDEARKAAEAYLKALARQGGDQALESLLGGATLRARAATIPDWKIVGREKHRHEAGQLENLHAFVTAVDAAGRLALAKLSGGSGGPTGDLQEITAEEATRILEPTRRKAKIFLTSHPVFAFLARVDKPVYWHPANPFRKLLTDAGEKGEYQADVDLFWVQTSRESGAAARRWPLRVVRFAANGKDTGLKILPASDWNAE
ncbi:MAG: hypothetical protein HY901_33010 [Deltaproteobacteria bacterium]|nr:hypothetical protein [Deltaproteobacteria bacterium]